MRQRYDVELTDEELRTAWLTEDRARRGLLRRAIGPAMVVLGVVTLASDGSPTARLVGLLALAFGLFHLARPFLTVARVLSERRRAGDTRIVVELADEGISLTRAGKTVRFPWKEVTAAGRRETYIWYELRGQHRAPIPLRAVSDPDALTALLRARTRWAD